MKIKKSNKILSFIITLTLMINFYSATPVYADTTSTNKYIGFTSDIHSKIPKLTKWLSNLKSTAPSLEYMVFGGDYVGGGDADSCISAVHTQYNGTLPILAKGNHENGKGGTYASGLVVNNDQYAIYAMDSSSKSFTTTDINTLKASLDSINLSKPVFVVSHCPIHYFGKRTTGNASELITLLNKYSNVIFLWGHNHTVKDTNYGVVKVKGDTIQCCKTSPSVPINFTYANMGCMKQGNNDAYGLLVSLASLDHGTNIDFYYKDLSGKTVSNYSVSIKKL